MSGVICDRRAGQDVGPAGDTFIDFCCFFQFKGRQSSRRLSKHPFSLEDEQVGRTTEEGGAACGVLPAASPDDALQTSPVAVSALLRLEALSPSKHGRQFRSELQRGTKDLSS